ncbi:hypothetical protein ADEAN_000254600 [Angomonas deanei]|uniref:Uncharacterized protein n=1 Tax=Angomonas deanei TaxID=59799 RepID=A0A7G2C8K7_9TRYP|nr:hypothetical protein ADEAN_000254600 [Angomonas deanei]
MGSKPSTDADSKDEVIEITKKKEYPSKDTSKNATEKTPPKNAPKPIYGPGAGGAASNKIGFKSKEDGEEGKDIENKAFAEEKVKRVPTKGVMLPPPKNANSCVADTEYDFGEDDDE